MATVALAEQLELAPLAEKLWGTFDRVQGILATDDLSDAHLAEAKRLEVEIERLIEVLEDSLDLQQTADALAESEREGTIPWSDMRDRFIA